MTAREKEKKFTTATYIRKMKNRVGILETKFISCLECGEEFCLTETCRIFAYDDYERVFNIPTTVELTVQDNIGPDKKKYKRKKKTVNVKNIKKKKKATKIKSKSGFQAKNLENKTFTKSNTVSKSKLKQINVNKVKKSQNKLPKIKFKINNNKEKKNDYLKNFKPIIKSISSELKMIMKRKFSKNTKSVKDKKERKNKKHVKNQRK